MRPFTKAVLKIEGKYIVGSRWSRKQVNQAFEKADNLLDLISEYKMFEPVQTLGLDKIHTGFEDSLTIRLEKNMPNKALQILSIGVLETLLTRGEDVLKYAAYSYKYTPDIFKTQYSSSKQAFFKDKLFCKIVPEYSFSPFKTGDNPAVIQDIKSSQTYVSLFHDSFRPAYANRIQTSSPNYSFWLCLPIGEKFLNEMIWLKKVTKHLRQKRLGRIYPASYIIHKRQNTL